nr:helix-turn-helix transcriptional regulator [Pseudanabaena sp. FACHB-2040]
MQIQAEWIALDAQQASHIVVTLEDLTEVAHQRALFDAFRYRLTPREAEVWELYLQGFSYRQIGKALFITINTVKRHMKSIHVKRTFRAD